MTLSIRARLLLWVIGGTAVLLTFLAFVVYGVLYRSLMGGFDAILESTARTIISSVEQNEETVKAEIDEREIPEFHRAERPDYFQLWRADGSVLMRSASLKGADLESTGGLLAPVFRPLRLPDGRLGRAVGIVFVPKVDDETKGVVQPQKVTLVVARETTGLDAQVKFLRWLMAAATGGTIILGLVVGAVIVRQGLRPLDTLAARIATIRQDDLSTHIPCDRMPAEVVPVVQRLNDLLRRLEEAFRRERAFTADAAHELRTPLAGMRSTLEVALARPREGEDYRNAMSDCLEIIGRMQSMVDNLLALARLEGGQMMIRPEAVCLGELVETTWRSLADQARKRGIADERHVSPDLACVADRDIMIMILTNLLGNAAEYTNDGGRIEIVARRAGETVELVIANSGCNISEEDVQQVFERFWRGDSSRTGTGIHCGLGLALVQRAVASLGGAVTAGVNDGTFTVRLTFPAPPRCWNPIDED